MFDLEIRGLDELLAQLEAFEREWHAEVADGLGRAARTVAANTAADTPVRTGRAKRGLKGLDGQVTDTAGAVAAVISIGTPSAYFVASEREILEHDAEEVVCTEAAAAMERALRRAFK